MRVLGTLSDFKILRLAQAKLILTDRWKCLYDICKENKTNFWCFELLFFGLLYGNMEENNWDSVFIHLPSTVLYRKMEGLVDIHFYI